MKRLLVLVLALLLLLPSFSLADVPRGTIRYDGNGGTSDAFGDCVDRRIMGAHLRENTLQGTSYFHREGYVLTGWNTAPDGTGEHIGLGSRVAFADGLTLYAEWAEANPASDFSYALDGEHITVTGYAGGADCVIPETVDGLPVTAIAANAFAFADLTRLVLPPSLKRVEDGAFTSGTIAELTVFDSLTEVSDASFQGTVISTLHINAAAAPVYSGSYFDTFADKYDYLISLGDAKKLVLFSGSSGRYGYDSPAIEAALPEYRVVNMGVYAYTNALPQLDLIRPYLQKGDILLDAPEFDAVAEQFCTTNRLDAGFWAMMESNYDMAAALDFSRYTGVFDSYAAYRRTKAGMAGRNYGESPFSYDDDGNRYNFPTYNLYGDFILPRPNSARDELHRHNIADYTVQNITPEAVDALDAALSVFTEAGVTVWFTYAPRNRSSLTETSTPEAMALVERTIRERLSVPVISTMADSLFSGVYFWQIDNHLSTEGVQLRTVSVIRDLKVQMVGEGLLPPEAPGPVVPFAWWETILWTLYGLAALFVLLGRLIQRWPLLPYLAGVVWAAATVFALVARVTPSIVLLTALAMLLLLTVGKRGERA